MAIKRGVRIDPSKLGISQNPELDRQQLLERARMSSKVDRVMESRGSDGAGALRIRERLNQRGLYLSMSDLMGVPSPSGPSLDRTDLFQGMETDSRMLTEDFPTNHDNVIMEENFQEYSGQPRRVQHQPRALPQQAPRQARQSLREPAPSSRQSLREQITARQPVAAPPWQVKAFLGETRGGGQVPVWKVVNGKTGTAIDKLFRIETIASRIADLLNESGDNNDPRALSLMHNYDKRDRLLKEARALEKTADGKPMKTERLRAVRAEISQLDYRLGI